MNDWHDAEEHVERAHQHYEAGRWDEAESELRKALSRNPFQAEWHFNLGLTLDAAGRFDSAVEAFRQAQSLEPDDPQICIMLGVATHKAGSPQDALGWYDRAEASQAEAADASGRDAAWSELAMSIAVHRIEAMRALGRHDEAETAFYLAQELDAPSAPLYAAMADSLLDRGLHEKAIWCLREAGRLDPELPRVAARLAEAYERTGRLERARTLYLQELRRDPGDLDSLLELGELLVKMGRLTEAGEKFRRVLEIEPDEIDAHFGLADLFERSGDVDAAIGAFGVVARIDARHRGVRRRLAALLISRARDRDLGEARRLLRHEAREVRRESHAPGGAEAEPEILESLGRLFLQVSLPSEASGVLRALLETHPDHASAHHLLGAARFRMGDRDGGMEHSRRAIELDPNCVKAMHNLAMGCLQQGHWTRAGYWVERARALDPDDASLRRLSMRLRLWAVADVFNWVARRSGRRRVPR
ncbi:MAG: tetratricopeptide repeat protein [Phycisphaerales bacterium]|nr:tetratricopeptide repeat protein [Phycisphaerales bacterium]